MNSWTGEERRFHVVIAGVWDGDVLTLVEDFDYADGEKDRKTWRLRRTGAGAFVGTREDVVGQARVRMEGRIVRLEYVVQLGGWTVEFADALALRDDGSLINKAIVGKWGCASDVSNSCCAEVPPEVGQPPGRRMSVEKVL